MVVILKAMIAMAEEYVGDVHTAKLERKEHGKEYTHDRIKITGITEEGQEYTLELLLEDQA